jgi:hypothetical protein
MAAQGGSISTRWSVRGVRRDGEALADGRHQGEPPVQHRMLAQQHQAAGGGGGNGRRLHRGFKFTEFHVAGLEEAAALTVTWSLGPGLTHTMRAPSGSPRTVISS